MPKVWGRKRLGGLLLGVCWCAGWDTGARAQQGPVGPVPATLTDVLLEMSSHAAVVFAGQVMGVARHDEQGYVDVRFRVDEPVRGCSKLGFYVLREWAGRWVGHADRYRAGQRLLMLLPARGPGGLSAPVNGSDGAIPLSGAAAGPIAGKDGVSPDDGSGGVAAAMVDLRLLQARVVRANGMAEGNGTGTVGILQGSGAGSGSGPAVPIAPIEVVQEGALSVQAPLGTVLALLRGGVSGGAYAAQ